MTRRSDLTTGLRDRADQVLERADDVRERAPEMIEDLRPVVRRTEIRAWSLLRAATDVLLLVPRIVVRVLGVLADTIDELADRGEHLAERGREVADSLPAARSTRRRRRVRGALWVTGGFAAGFVTGWLVAQRQAEELVYEATDAEESPLEGASGNGSAVRTAALAD